MEGISRKDLNRISQILSNHVNTDESIKLATKLTEFDFIPKMYAYTYFKRFYQEIEDIKTTNIDVLDAEMLEGLDLHLVTQHNLNGIKRLLKNAFDREDCFCDFEDSKYNGQTKMCQCQSDEHFEDIQEHEILSEKDYTEYQKMRETDEGADKAEEIFHDRLNPVTKCTPFYMPNEYNHKYDDEPTWTCKICSDKFDGGDYDGDFTVSCDMEIGE